MDVRPHLSACGGFWLWAVAGALTALSVLATLSFGVFVLPAAAAAVWAARRFGSGREAIGMLAGAGLLLVAIGSLTRPATWLAAGLALVLVSLAAFPLLRRKA